MADVLDKLMSLEIVQKRAPINDPTNKRKSGYFVVDPLSLFYYRYVFRNASARQLLDPEVFYDRHVSQDFEENYVPHMFEEICRQYLVRQNRTGKIEPAFDAIGKYWYDDPANKTSGEFDVVTQDPEATHSTKQSSANPPSRKKWSTRKSPKSRQRAQVPSLWILLPFGLRSWRKRSNRLHRPAADVWIGQDRSLPHSKHSLSNRTIVRWISCWLESSVGWAMLP